MVINKKVFQNGKTFLNVAFGALLVNNYLKNNLPCMKD